jgi:hypothetical protein
MISVPSLPPLETRTSRHASIESIDLNAKWGERYTVGVDLGQSNDFTAICIVRKLEEPGQKPIFQVGHLSRIPLGTPYPAVVSHVIDLLCRPQIRGKCELVIDYTGVGRPVFDMFRDHGTSPIGVNITGGTAITHEGLIWSVPKGHLISRIQMLLHAGRLEIHSDLPDASALVGELQSFKADFTDTGYIKFNARSGAHDDLVLALGVALWRAYGDDQHTGILEYYKRAAARGGFSDSKPITQKARVTLKSPVNVSTVCTINGRSLNVSDDGTFELDEEEARPLLHAGWVKVAA